MKEPWAYAMLALLCLLTIYAALDAFALFRLGSMHAKESVCVPKIGPFAPTYCIRDEEEDERAGFHTFKPPLHVMWCSCFWTEPP